jgi:hypothetical protein
MAQRRGHVTPIRMTFGREAAHVIARIVLVAAAQWQSIRFRTDEALIAVAPGGSPKDPTCISESFLLKA